jgi:ABC-type transport system involved in multi-copper enzyme maturation permease subunit
MLSSLTNVNVLASGLLFAVIQAVFALPWLYALDSKGFKSTARSASGLGWAAGVVLGVGLAFAVVLGYKSSSNDLLWWGRTYGIILHLQLLADLFIGVPYLLTLVLPKTGAVALAAYREGWRQPMFWLILAGGLIGTWISVVLPYFTFGDDFKMMKQIGFDIMMLCALLFGVLAASMSVSEEIEGRTAITVMSKPINRRSFLVGKFLGITMASAGMSLLLAVNFNAALMANRAFDPINEDRTYDPMPEQAKQKLVPAVLTVTPTGPAQPVATGAAMWLGEQFAHSFGLLLGFGKVMILVAIATALATRLHFVVTLVIALFVFLFGHLAPVIVRVTEMSPSQSTGTKLVGFLANVSNVLLPALEFFNMSPAIIRDTPLDLGGFIAYSLTVFGYAIIYTTIALVVGLLLFEDRDLA